MVSNRDDIIDSRDIVEQLEGATDREEIELLSQLVRDLENASYDDPIDGITLIRDSYFEDYAVELAEDLGLMTDINKSGWPYTCIDWNLAAMELQMDYTPIEFGGITYWVR